MSEPHAHDESAATQAAPPSGHSTAVQAAAGHVPGPHELPFTDAEWQTLQASDLAAARAVVTLLLGVFCIGVVLYSIVCVTVSS